MINDQIFPTDFALSLCIKSGIIEGEGSITDFSEHQARIRRLGDFQKMALSSSFKDSSIAFIGLDLKKRHRKCLKVIYKSTRPFARSYIKTTLTDRLRSPDISGEDARMFMEIIEELGSND